MNNVLSGTFRVYGGGRDAALRFSSLKKQHNFFLLFLHFDISTFNTTNVILYVQVRVSSRKSHCVKYCLGEGWRLSLWL